MRARDATSPLHGRTPAFSHLFTPEQTRPPLETRCSFREDRVPVTMIVHATRRKELLLVKWRHETLQNGGGLKPRAQQSIQQHGERQQQEWEESNMVSEPDRLQSLFVLHKSLQVIAIIRISATTTEARISRDLFGFLSICIGIAPYHSHDCPSQRILSDYVS